ncbi:MAG: hypothetical protein RJA70_3579 [Pseudomonadota bacterium]|jgi:EAL domain-containing protein (putative c-di-GMP-specific phosphodiesterase class I)
MTHEDTPPSKRSVGRWHVLLVDDNPTLLRSFGALLESRGHRVEAASSGLAAIQRVEKERFDVVLTDIAMPQMDGVELLRSIRGHDLDVPVVLITGQPAVETAVKAVEYGAYKYLTKPVAPADLLATIDEAGRVCKLARARRTLSHELGNDHYEARDLAGIEAHFERALETITMAYQPILSRGGGLYGYEALLRSGDAAFPSPLSLLHAAELLHRTTDLGRKIRAIAPIPLAESESEATLFVNLHPMDLTDPLLLDPECLLTQHASRVVLEITERAGLPQISNAPETIQELRRLGFRIAIDDLGSGYAGLNSLAILEPDIVKLDMLLVRDVHLSLTKQKLVSTVASLCRDMGSIVVAEGVETEDEERMLLQLGCDLLQGYLYAKPGPAFPALRRTPADSAPRVGSGAAL